MNLHDTYFGFFMLTTLSAQHVAVIITLANPVHAPGCCWGLLAAVIPSFRSRLLVYGRPPNVTDVFPCLRNGNKGYQPCVKSLCVSFLRTNHHLGLWQQCHFRPSVVNIQYIRYMAGGEDQQKIWLEMDHYINYSFSSKKGHFMREELQKSFSWILYRYAYWKLQQHTVIHKLCLYVHSGHNGHHTPFWPLSRHLPSLNQTHRCWW